MNCVQESYERLAYPHYVHPLTDPARLAAIGRLLGVHTADPRAARVLDIGCGAGTNLLTMAERLPGSRFVGIDFAANQVAAGRALAAAAGLRHVQLQQADLLTWEPDAARYDYIIAHGFFSWVRDEVKEQLFRVCGQCLAPHGLACISYMTYPGCKSAEALRDLLLLRTGTDISPAEKVRVAHRTLDFLDAAYARLPNWPHSVYLRDQVQHIRRKEPHYLLLDDLGVERDPCYLLQFVNWAAEHELHYVGESEFHTMFLENLPPESARELAALGLDRLQTEQILDYVVNRSFRCSLLVGPEARRGAGWDAQAIRELCLQPRLRPAMGPEDRQDQAIFINDTGLRITLRSVPLVAFVRTLATRPGALTPFAEIRAQAEFSAGRAFNRDELHRLCEDLLSLVVRRQIGISASPFAPPASLPARPCLTPLNQATTNHLGLAVTAFQDAIRLESAEQALCGLLDGRRNLTELQQSPEGRVLGDVFGTLLDRLRRNGCLASPRVHETPQVEGTVAFKYK